MSAKWFEIASKEIGVHETHGGETPRILAYHDCTTLDACEDEIPWCSSFVNWCMTQAGLPCTKSAAAISWANYGVELDNLRHGCIVVIRQKSKAHDAATGSSSGNHVAFFDRIEGDYICLLGGNQSDSVKISGFRQSSYDIVAMRWPEGVE